MLAIAAWLAAVIIASAVHAEQQQLPAAAFRPQPRTLRQTSQARSRHATASFDEWRPSSRCSTTRTAVPGSQHCLLDRAIPTDLSSPSVPAKQPPAADNLASHTTGLLSAASPLRRPLRALLQHEDYSQRDSDYPLAGSGAGGRTSPGGLGLSSPSITQLSNGLGALQGAGWMTSSTGGGSDGSSAASAGSDQLAAIGLDPGAPTPGSLSGASGTNTVLGRRAPAPVTASAVGAPLRVQASGTGGPVPGAAAAAAAVPVMGSSSGSGVVAAAPGPGAAGSGPLPAWAALGPNGQLLITDESALESLTSAQVLQQLASVYASGGRVMPAAAGSPGPAQGNPIPPPTALQQRAGQQAAAQQGGFQQGAPQLPSSGSSAATAASVQGGSGRSSSAAGAPGSDASDGSDGSDGSGGGAPYFFRPQAGRQQQQQQRQVQIAQANNTINGTRVIPANATGPFGALVRGEVAPYCQPPLWACTNRDLLNFLAVQTDQVIFPLDVINPASVKARNNLAFTLNSAINVNPIGGGRLTNTLNLANQLSSINNLGWQFLNGAGVAGLQLANQDIVGTRWDRLVPEAYNYNFLTPSLTANIDRASFKPTYLITGTGPGLATVAVNFGPFGSFLLPGGLASALG